MAERRVKVVFEASILGYKRAMEEAAAATKKTKEAAEQTGKAADQASQTAARGSKAQADAAKEAAAAVEKQKTATQEIGTVAAAAGALTLAGVGMAVKSYADFDKQMSSVNAATHETAGNMDLLKQAAVEAGAETSFSAVEAAKGIEELAKAGVTTTEILNGGLDGALSLAAAGSLDVGKAAEIAASALTQFKLEGSDIPHVADLLAAGAGKAQGSVEDLGAALNQSGLVAAQTGLTIEETTGGLAAFASAGLVGSDAGTSFKTMLAALTPNSEASAKAMEELGISAYDSQGKFVGLSEFAGQLKGSLSGLTDEQRNSTLETIFGSDAVRAASVLYEQGAEGVQKWEEAVNDAGYAAETAAMMQDNLAGDLEKLGGAFDTVLLQSGSGANEVLRGLVQGLEGVVDAIGKVPAPVLSAVTGFAAVLGGAALLGGGLITVIPKIRDTKDALEVLAPAGSKANAALSRTGKIAAGAATGLAAVAAAASLAGPAMDEILKPTGPTGDALEKFAGQAAQGAVGADTLNLAFQDLVEHKNGVGDFQTAIEGIADPGLWGNIDNILTDTIGLLTLGMVDLKSTSEEARGRFKAFGEELASLDSKKAASAFQSMAEETNGSEQSLKNLLDFMPAYRKSLEDQAEAAGLATDDQTLLNIAMGKIPTDTKPAEKQAETIEDVGNAAEQAAKQADGLVESLLAMNNVNLSAADAQLGFDQAIADSAENLVNAGAGVDYLNEKTGEFNQTAADNIELLNGIASQGNQTAQAVYDQTGSYDKFRESLESSRQSLFDVAKAYYPTEEAAWAYVDSVMAIPPEMKTVVDITDNGTIEGVKGNLKLLHEAIQGTPDKTVIIKEPMSPAIKKGLENLGYIVTHLPDGTIQVSETGTTATGQKIDATAGKKRTATINAAAITGAAENALNYTARARNSVILQEIRQSILPVGGDAPPKSIARRSTGGILRGYSDGGQLPSTGPGTEVTDGFLGIDMAGRPVARLDANEWIINGHSSDRYNRELAAINAGTFPKLPGYADGARHGREYSAQQLGYTPHRAGSESVSVSAPAVTVMIGNEQLDTRMYRVASTAISSADSQSKRMRKGR